MLKSQIHIALSEPLTMNTENPMDLTVSGLGFGTGQEFQQCRLIRIDKVKLEGLKRLQSIYVCVFFSEWQANDFCL